MNISSQIKTALINKRHIIIILSLALSLLFSIFLLTKKLYSNQDAAKDPFKIDYIYGWKENNKTFYGALLFRLEPSWKTYWKHPGDSGIAPEFDWSNSQNISDIKFVWPNPKIMYTDNSMLIGYEKKLLLPIIITPSKQDLPIILNLKIYFGVCSDICIPAHTQISAPIWDHATPKSIRLIENALLLSPKIVKNNQLISNQCEVSKNSNSTALTYTLVFRNKLPTNTVAVAEYISKEIFITNQKSSLEKNKIEINIELSDFIDNHFIIERARLKANIIKPSSGIIVLGCS